MQQTYASLEKLSTRELDIKLQAYLAEEKPERYETAILAILHILADREQHKTQ